VVALQQASQTAIDNLPCLHHCAGVDRIGKPTNGADLHQTKINGRTGKPSNQRRSQAKPSVQGT
ncbi:hypothetical protein PpBr36_08379, partial [Pyricularia pennisetigena]|uniref:hypothetical protein n=1 Tax=Pyricularia pennisetigena TaxID=1578925 RepID=UPI001150B7DB